MRYACAILLVMTAASAAAAEPVDYAGQVLPLLAKHCISCHGEEEQQSGLRLDAGKLIHDGGDRGPGIVAGKSGESLLIKALRGEGDLKRMPFESDPLGDDEIALLSRWIDEGAKFPADEVVRPARRPKSDHWSFQPVRRPALPAVKNAEWPRSAIDYFVLAKLDQIGLSPSPEAGKETLIRRLSLDLRGLLPSVQEVDDFLADDRPDAYEQLVDRLLASPRYGERWGRQWLDAARYADSHGFTIDGARSIWKYRDWVIGAFNRDLPFDQFTIEQLAGDLLPGATQDQIVATGFHRNTLINQEGGTDQEQFRCEAVVDRVGTTGSVFLGLTVGCAQCHEHKYDPISQREFYQLFAVFNTCDEPTIPVPTAEESQNEQIAKAALAAAQAKLADYDKAARVRQQEWEQKLAAMPLDVNWVTFDLNGQFKSDNGATVTKLPDGSYLASGKIPPSDTYSATFEVPIKGATAIRLDALTDDSLPAKGPGLAANGNFILTDFEIERRTLAEPEKPIEAPIAAARADHWQDRFPVEHAIDDDPVSTGWAINVAGGSLNTNRHAIFILQQPLGENDTRVSITIRHAQPNHYSLGHFRVSMTTAPVEVLDLPADVRAALKVPPEKRTPEQTQIVATELKQNDPARKPLQDAVNQRKRELDALQKTFATTMVMREQSKPRPTHIHIRGDFLRHGARVSPGVPGVLNKLPEDVKEVDRLSFARWLVDPANPLAPRVAVNRVWQSYFGKGIVETEDDFGTQGSPPSHGELLDYVADEFIRQGFSFKALHRLIVTSATYRQSSRVSAEHLRLDPFNKWLARQSRLRLEAETIRDAALGAAGLLSEKIGGPSVFPPQPAGIYSFTQNQKNWTPSKADDRFRRGMYTYFWRSSPDPFLMTFDAPGRNIACTRRVRSNTPLQALTLANDLAFVEISQGLASRVLAESPSADTAERVRHAFRLCLSRQPGEAECQTLCDFVAAQRAHYRQRPADAKKIVPAAVAGAPAEDAAAWTALARVLLNLDEMITRE
ncbi:MAG: PSD1 domain-containing protein [Planctomycetia bacterium]|nr:PSD1 domain-containing protein [Planctomycetia bacterium]